MTANASCKIAFSEEKIKNFYTSKNLVTKNNIMSLNIAAHI